jgi:hypothetical protein
MFHCYCLCTQHSSSWDVNSVLILFSNLNLKDFLCPVVTFINIIWNGLRISLSLTVIPHIVVVISVVVIMNLECFGIIFWNLMVLLHIMLGVSLNEIGSANYRSWAVTLFVFFINSQSCMQNFQLMHCCIAVEVLSKLTVKLQCYCSDPFICIMGRGDTWFLILLVVKPHFLIVWYNDMLQSAVMMVM